MNVSKRLAIVAIASASLAGCQADSGAQATADTSCSPGLGSHLCSSEPADPRMSADPSVQSEGAVGRGGGH